MTAPVSSDWDADRLSQFISAAQANEKLVCQELYKHEPRLSQIFDVFELCIDVLTHNAEPRIPAFMFHRAVGAFLGGCRLTMSGQFVEAHPVLRLCLELSLYSLHIHRNSEAGVVWENRAKSSTAYSKCRNEFGAGNVLRTLKGVDPKLGEVVERIYSDLVDFGAHPNIDAIYPSVSWKASATVEEYSTHLLVPPDNILMPFTLNQCARVSLKVLLIYCHVFTGRFEVLDVRGRVNVLGAGLPG